MHKRRFLLNKMLNRVIFYGVLFSKLALFGQVHARLAYLHWICLFTTFSGGGKRVCCWLVEIYNKMFKRFMLKLA